MQDAETTLGAGHEQSLVLQANLAAVRAELGDDHEAAAGFGRAARAAAERFGPDHPWTVGYSIGTPSHRVDAPTARAGPRYPVTQPDQASDDATSNSGTCSANTSSPRVRSHPARLTTR
jgi:hypothetical protein